MFRQSPAMQSLLNDHDFMRSLLKMDPRLSKVGVGGGFEESDSGWNFPSSPIFSKK